jgi:hypothetical protein
MAADFARKLQGRSDDLRSWRRLRRLLRITFLWINAILAALGQRFLCGPRSSAVLI